MEIEVTEKKPLHHHLIKNHHKLIAFLIFLSILALLIYTSFNGSPFTGSVITGSVIGVTENNSLRFNAELTTPNLELEGNFEKVEILGGSDSFFYVGNQKFDLGNSERNYLIFENYEGEISSKENGITLMKGKASKVTMNGILITSQTKDTTKVNFEGNFDFNSLEIKEKVSIKELAYITSGIVRLNEDKNIFNLNNEEIVITNFNGDLIIENGRSKFNGYVRKLDIKGDSEVSVFS